jgi:uncharacterized protein with von Willebrand factor type A (vWA) domain
MTMNEKSGQDFSEGKAGGRLAENIMHFARVLRGAGLPVGPGQVLDALEAAQTGCLRSKHDFYAALHSVFVKRHDHDPIFEQAFHIFWRKPKMMEQLLQLLFPQISRPANAKKKQAGHRRLAAALFDDNGPMHARREEPAGELELDATYSFSSQETLRRKDFEQMTVEEQVRAKRAIAAFRSQRLKIKTRRFSAMQHGERIDPRRTFKSSVGSGGDLIDLQFKRRKLKEPPLVVLCDISGSMSNYSRMFLHFLHALSNDRDRVHIFVFGTRLTNITRELKRTDVDEAMEKISSAVQDWSGGTRMGESLRAFNYLWARRVLTQGAHVILMSDGLDRDDVSILDEEMARLRRSARRIIWLNPLLRYSGFEPRAAGVRAIMPHVDEFRPVHNLASLEDLGEALASPPEKNTIHGAGKQPRQCEVKDDRYS